MDTPEEWGFKAAEIKRGNLSSSTPKNWNYPGQSYAYSVQSMSFASMDASSPVRTDKV